QNLQTLQFADFKPRRREALFNILVGQKRAPGKLRALATPAAADGFEIRRARPVPDIDGILGAAAAARMEIGVDEFAVIQQYLAQSFVDGAVRDRILRRPVAANLAMRVRTKAVTVDGMAREIS